MAVYFFSCIVHTLSRGISQALDRVSVGATLTIRYVVQLGQNEARSHSGLRPVQAGSDGERIGDKIAASKGMWMGGPPQFGHRNGQ